MTGKKDLGDTFGAVGDFVKEHPVATLIATLGVLYFLAKVMNGLPYAGAVQTGSAVTALGIATAAASTVFSPTLKKSFDHVSEGNFKEAFSDLREFMGMMSQDDDNKKQRGLTPAPAAN